MWKERERVRGWVQLVAPYFILRGSFRMYSSKMISYSSGEIYEWYTYVLNDSLWGLKHLQNHEICEIYNIVWLFKCRLFLIIFCTWSFWIQMNTREVPWHTVGSNQTFVFSSSPKQTDMRHKTKRQQVHAEDVNPLNDTPITSNSTHPNSLWKDSFIGN